MAFGPVAGGVAGLLMLFANAVGSSAALARFFLDTLGATWPEFAHFIARRRPKGMLELAGKREWDEGYDYKRERSRS